MRLHLRRFAEFGDDGTFGVLQVGGWRGYTVERRWKGNEPFVSCIPVGLYKLVLHEEGEHEGTWALVGETVSYKEDPACERYLILLHSANIASEVKGCIAPGLGMGFWRGHTSVTSSRGAMRYVLGYLDWDVEHEILIEEEMGGW